MTLHDYITSKVTSIDTKKDDDFFTCYKLKKYFENIANAMAHRGITKRVSVEIAWGGDFYAFTDNYEIKINANCDFSEAMDRYDRFRVVKGFLFHEVYHLIYTNFEMYSENIENSTSINEEIKKYFEEHPRKKSKFKSIVNYIYNILEDAYIEARGNQDFKKFGKDVKYVRKLQREASEDMFEGTDLQVLLNLFLSYCVNGLDLTPDQIEDERVVKLLEVVDLADLNCASSNNYLRYHYANKIIESFWDIIKEYLDSKEEETKSNSSPLPKNCGTSLKAKSDDDEDEQPEDEEDIEGGDSTKSKDSEESTKPGDSKDSKESESSKEFESKSSSEKKDAKKEAVKRLKKAKKESSLSSEGEKEEVDELTKTLSELDDETMSELLTEFNESKAGEYGVNHSEVKCTIDKATASDTDRKCYEVEAKHTYKLGKRMASSLKEDLSAKRLGARLDGELFGKRISKKHIVTPDGRMFYRDILPENVTYDTDVCVLVDESGSMSMENRIKYAKQCAILIYSICDELEIPISVYGHTADIHERHSVELKAYADFEKKSKSDLYALTQMRAKSNNRDGYAIKYCCGRLDERTAKKKLFFIISDGLPAASSYGGNAAVDEIRDLLRTYTKKGICIIAAGIGSDKDNLEKIYEGHFLPIDDLKTLPKQLGKLLRRHITTKF